jgi:hypothetical protein
MSLTDRYHSLAHGVDDTLSALTEDGLSDHQSIGAGVDHVRFLPAVAPVALGDLGESPSGYNSARVIVIVVIPNVILIPLGEVSQGRSRQLARHVSPSAAVISTFVKVKLLTSEVKVSPRLTLAY